MIPRALTVSPYCRRCGANLLAPDGARSVVHRSRADFLLLAFVLGLLAGLGIGAI